jgi:molybdopterin/thiamine biosynthesis adenylyltransferase
MCGLGTKAPHSIMVADNDIVERSNLSRQFLYRSCDIKKKKANCAVEAAKAMNSDLKAVPRAELINEVSNTF